MQDEENFLISVRIPGNKINLCKIHRSVLSIHVHVSLYTKGHEDESDVVVSFLRCVCYWHHS